MSEHSIQPYRLRISAKAKRERLAVYKAIAVMVESGIPIFGAFEFMADQVENEQVRESCHRMAQELATGFTLSAAARREPVLFSDSSARLLDVGMKSGQLVAVLKRLADDEQKNWEMKQRIWGQLVYPLCLALLALGVAIILPPLVLSRILEQVVTLTDEPPALSVAILKGSRALSSPLFLSIALLVASLTAYLLTKPNVRDKLLDLEGYVWRIPWIGDVPRIAFSCRFLQVFSLSYEVGLPADQCLRLAARASGSRVIALAGGRMSHSLQQGDTISESIASAGILPKLAVEAVRAGEQVAELGKLIGKASDILLSELDYRIEAAMKLMEPMLLLVLGFFVGLFAVGCLLPILKLAETL